jgi:hypothetical protein
MEVGQLLHTHCCEETDDFGCDSPWMQNSCQPVSKFQGCVHKTLSNFAALITKLVMTIMAKTWGQVTKRGIQMSDVIRGRPTYHKIHPREGCHLYGLRSKLKRILQPHSDAMGYSNTIKAGCTGGPLCSECGRRRELTRNTNNDCCPRQRGTIAVQRPRYKSDPLLEKNTYLRTSGPTNVVPQVGDVVTRSDGSGRRGATKVTLPIRQC